MQHLKTKATLTPTDSWLLGHASALISYADSDTRFAESLAHHVQARVWSCKTTNLAQTGTIHLRPTNQEAAVETATWMLQSLDETEGATTTKNVLGTWAQQYHEPKDLVIGIVGLAIIGPTLGIINKKKKTKSHLQVVINNRWQAEKGAEELAKLVQTISMEQVAKELQLAGGNAYGLHPDTAAWCLEEACTKIYFADQAELEAITAAAKQEGLSHQLRKTDTEITAIALSPAINDEMVNDFDVTEV